MRTRSALLGLVLAALAAGGCVGGSKGISAEDKDKLKPFVLDAVPADAKKADVNFENKARLVGFKIEPETAKPGQTVKLTYYWKSEDAIEDGWLLFTHLHDAVADKSDNLDWTGPLREQRGSKQILGPDRWEKGRIYADEQSYTLPDWVSGPEIDVMVGIWKGDARLRVVAGANDGDNRALVGKIKTGLAPKEPEKPRVEVPSLTVNKLAAADKITIDGKGDEAAWKTAASTGAFVDVATGRGNTSFPVNGVAKLAWDDQSLYVLFEVQDPEVTGGFDPANKGKDEWTTSGQPKLWMKDTVEIMADPDGDGDNKDYYEIQVNPQNRVFKTQYDAYNTPKQDPNGPFGHEDWDAKIRSAVQVRGTVDKAGDKDDGYTVEIAIPWASFAKAANHPPKSGDVWRMNFYAMENNGGTAWSPILGQGNFHRALRFGRVTFAGGTPPAAPAPPTSAPPAPSPSAPPAASGAGVRGASPRPH